MFLTIYKLDPENPIMCKAVLDAAEMHKCVQYLFNSARKDHQVLYRVEQGYLLVQSDIKPNPDKFFKMVRQYDMEKKMEEWGDKTSFRFRIRTAPKASVKGVKLLRKTEEDRLKWLKSQFQKRGMDIRTVREDMKVNIRVSSKKSKDGNHMIFSAWEYEGVFDVADKTLFKDAYKNGIGSQKAYGCGMICLCG